MTRAAVVWPDKDHATIVLDHLKNVRNDIIHESANRGDYNVCVSQCLQFLHALILVHFEYAGVFGSMAEAGEFLSLVALGKKEIERRGRLSNEALALIQHRDRKTAPPDYSI